MVADVAQAPVAAHDLAPSTGAGTSSLPSKASAPGTDAAEVIAAHFASSLQSAFRSGSIDNVLSHFAPDGYWRDLLSLQWDFRTLQGHANIRSFLQEGDKLSKEKRVENMKVELGSVSTAQPFPNTTWIQAFFDFETGTGRGRGLFRLTQPQGGKEWKAYTFYTGIEEIKGHEEKAGATRGQGVDHGQHAGRKSWKTRRAGHFNYQNGREPEVIIIGGGQAGLTLAARLGQLDVDALIVERNPRIGDNWRNRYDFLVLHDPVWYDHLPYMPFPAHWPVFTPKDKLAAWLESYVDAMEINAWTSTTLDAAKYDDSTSTWSVDVTRADGTKRTLRPKHVVLATGHSGEPNVPTFKGQEKFKGKIVHSSQHTTGGDFKGKKAIVVGCCNSGHDIAHDFYEQGADITVVQRSSTYVMSSESVVKILFDGLYCEGGPTTEDADIMFSSTPNFLHKRLHKDVTAKIAEFDKSTLDGLTKAGFKLDFGPDDSGFLMKYFTRGGGYYLDVGASKLIADGKIKIKQGQEIDHFTEDSIVFADGSKLAADIVVLATGYQNMRTTAEKLLGSDVSSRTTPVWGLDDEGELRTMWRNSGHPGFYYMGGNLALCRFFSKRLALIIKAKQIGLHKV